MAWQRIAAGIAVAGLAALAPAAHGHELRAARASLASLPAMPAPSQSADAPDLRIGLPSVAYSGQVAPVYVDAHEQSGRLLYRFDAVIQNTGGALDLSGGPDEVWQKIWPGGEPTTPPTPSEPASDVTEDRTGSGARFAYVEETTHEHWHFFSAARYSLLVPGGAARVSDKVGFCMYDSFGIEDGATRWFPWEAGPGTWCQDSDPDATVVRMGLSRGASDRYSSQREFQYVDVTGLTPGAYTLQAQANPAGHLIEADPSDDVHEEQRMVPGVVAEPAALAATAGAWARTGVTARAIAPEIPARRDARCTPRATIESCYLRITAAEPRMTYAVASGPAHGIASFDGAQLLYTPAAGFTGKDSLTYVATDGRGLRSTPATVAIDVAPAPIVVVDPPPPADARRLLKLGRVRRTAPRRLAVRLVCRVGAVGTCSGVLEARVAGKRVGRVRFAGLAAGRRRTVVLRLRRSAVGRRVVLRAVVRDAAGSGVTATAGHRERQRRWVGERGAARSACTNVTRWSGDPLRSDVEGPIARKRHFNRGPAPSSDVCALPHFPTQSR